MIQPQLFFRNGNGRTAVKTLASAVRATPSATARYERSLMTATQQLESCCEWDGFAIVKGVTHPQANLTVFGFPSKIIPGYHARLAKGFPGIPIDPFPQCYDNQSLCRGFGGFTRWTYFVNPFDHDDVLGIDFHIAHQSRSGAAQSITRAASVVHCLALQGIGLRVKVALINWYMAWYHGVAAMQRSAGLVTIGDWLIRVPQLIYPAGPLCPRCGLGTMTDRRFRFCTGCGCNPDIMTRSDRDALTERESPQPTHQRATFQPLAGLQVSPLAKLLDRSSVLRKSRNQLNSNRKIGGS